MKKIFKPLIILLYSFLLIYGLFYFGQHPLFHFTFFKSSFINTQMNLQLSTVLLSLSMVGLLLILTHKTTLFYLSFKLQAPMKEVKWLGIPKGNFWLPTGLIIALLISSGTALNVFLQLKTSSLHFPSLLTFILVLILALMNAFTEEVIFRLSYVSLVKHEGWDEKWALFLGTTVFGLVHYFGMAPKGIMGALMAGFLGWFLTKSILESKGFFWAWFIHFLQDVVILLLFVSL